jgi:osmotically-inducible protein OsmY
MMTTNRLLLVAVLAATSVPMMQGCIPIVATGVTAGALMAVDRRISENYIADEAIEDRALLRIGQRLGDNAHVNVTSYNLNVLLTGEAINEATRAEAEQIVQGVPNVKAITNEIRIAGASSLTARSNDAYITSKVKARFVEADKFPANNVKVVTEAGVVYLLGLVTRAEADAATEIARTTGGVAKVVRVFEYLTPEQAQQMDRRARDSSKASGSK